MPLDPPCMLTSRGASGGHLCLDYGPLAQRVLLESGSYVPPAVLVVDLRPLLMVKSQDGQGSQMMSNDAVELLFDAEAAEKSALGKRLGKPLGRELSKVHLEQSTMVVPRECASLVLKLLAWTDSHGMQRPVWRASDSCYRTWQ